MLKKIIVFGILFIYFGSFSQNIIGIEPRIKYGFLLPHRDAIKHLVQGHALGGELSIVFQTNGSEEWHKIYNYPRHGFTAYFSDFGNPEVLGIGFGAYAFGEMPIMKKNNWFFTSKLGLGLAGITKSYHQQKNPKNNVASTRLNSLIVLGFNVHKQFKQSQTSIGIDATHISNGAFKMPNLGLNFLYLTLGYTHYLEPITKKNDYDPTTSTVKNFSWKLNLLGVASTRQIYPTGGQNYFIGAMGVFASKQFKPKVAMDVGIDLISNQSLRYINNESGNSQLDIFQVGTYIGYVLPVNRFQYTAGMGVYIKNTINPNGYFYHRFGTRYKINDKLMANITIKAHWGRADYFEYGLIYNIF